MDSEDIDFTLQVVEEEDINNIFEEELDVHCELLSQIRIIDESPILFLCPYIPVSLRTCKTRSLNKEGRKIIFWRISHSTHIFVHISAPYDYEGHCKISA